MNPLKRWCSPEQRDGQRVAGMPLLLMVALAGWIGWGKTGLAEEDGNWSSGYYRADPERTPFKIRPEAAPRGPDWRDEEPSGGRWRGERSRSEEEEVAPPRVRVPRIWNAERSGEKGWTGGGSRPWGEIPSEYGRYGESEGRGRDPDGSWRRGGDPGWDEERRAPGDPSWREPSGSRRSRPPSSRWDGPYQREYSREPEWRGDAGSDPRDGRREELRREHEAPYPPAASGADERWWGRRGGEAFWERSNGGRERSWPEGR
ncbi:MAG: hypothetical protein HQL91_07570 [Magnetococcales bacterium]|nr:hypothetical protein [Magnetococcales bacterium]